MSGSIHLTEEEIAEMRLDAASTERRTAFAAARRLTQEGSLDDYINFLSENMSSIPKRPPRVHVTKDFRL